MEIELEILKEDILLNNYFSVYECPITRAFHRSGYHTYFDAGIEIRERIGLEHTVIANVRRNQSYVDLLVKLFGMYKSLTKEEYKIVDVNLNIIHLKSIPVQSFTHTLIL